MFTEFSEFSKAPVYGSIDWPDHVVPSPAPLWPPTQEFNQFISPQIHEMQIGNKSFNGEKLSLYLIEGLVYETLIWRGDLRLEKMASEFGYRL